MVFQFPPNIIALVVFATTAGMAVISLGLTGSLCNTFGWGYCNVQGTVAAGPALGIVASILGGLFSGLAICWQLFIPLWNFSHMKFVLFPGLGTATAFSFISAVILAWTCNNVAVGASYGTCGAASAFEFFLMFSVIASGVFVYLLVSKKDSDNNASSQSPSAVSPSPTPSAPTNEIKVDL